MSADNYLYIWPHGDKWAVTMEFVYDGIKKNPERAEIYDTYPEAISAANAARLRVDYGVFVESEPDNDEKIIDELDAWIFHLRRSDHTPERADAHLYRCERLIADWRLGIEGDA